MIGGEAALFEKQVNDVHTYLAGWLGYLFLLDLRQDLLLYPKLD